MTLRPLNYGNYGIFLMMGNAGFCPSTVRPLDYLLRPSGRSGVSIWPHRGVLRPHGLDRRARPSSGGNSGLANVYMKYIYIYVCIYVYIRLYE